MVNLLKQLLIFYINFMISLCLKAKNECGYKQCPQTRDGALNVHLIPHSHMDAGWVKTFDEYYYGTRASVSTANVQLIYHSVLSELLHDKRRKFTFSESAYFWRWWKEQRPNTRATFRSLVQEGRAEFAGGSWTQADSATVGYLTTLDMWTWGLRKLNDTLGPCGKPKAAWQIDTYGHTREQASLLAQMGFDGLFLGRVDHREREKMMEEDRMEFMWRGSDVLGKMSDIMTHTLYNLYNAPDGFCFDFLCNDEPVVDDPDSKAYNAEKRVNDFIAQIERQAKYYDHDNILVTMGGDFTYQSAANWFMNMDYLINHVKNHPTNMSDINIFYSSPSCYLKSIYLYGRRDKAMYTERGDHLPYGSDANTYWTGFYTSRPSFKYLVRKAHVFLQVVKHLTVISQSADSYELHLLRHAVGLALHHDAITGTSQQHVTDDFIRILSEAIDACTKKISNFLSNLTPTWGVSRRTKNNQQFFVCHELNISQCLFMDTQESILLLVYNPLSIKTYHYVRLPAIALHYSIRDYNDEEMEYQLLPLPAAVTNLPGRSSNAIQDLVFEAENIPAMGYSAYFISPIRDQLKENDLAKKAKSDTLDAEQEIIPSISNEFLKVTIDQSTGLLESISHVDGVRIQITQNFFAYSPSRLGLESGAYSFRPGKQRPDAMAHKVQYNTIRGSLVKEIRQRFTDWITQTIRLYRGEEFVELDWVIGPVPIGTDLGKEVVTIFSTNITNNGEFFTDSNGRQMMKRSCFNETAGHQTKKPVPACYFPVTSRICIRSPNSSVEMCVLPDRSQGGTSYKEGEIELMVHRRLLTDDGFGLEETLNEEAFGMGLVVKGRHRIIFGNFKQEVDDISFSERISQSARRGEMEPLLFLTSGDKVNRRKWQNVRNKRYSALTSHGLPRHIHILTLEPWKGGSVLLRLENTHESNDRGKVRPDSDVLDTRAHITVELRKIFLHRKIRAIRETTLAANQWLEDARQMDWSSRYFYKGGDDGILAEDQVEDDGSTTRAEKDSGNYSDENQDYTKKNTQKPSGKTRGNTKHRFDYDRKKRSINDPKYSVNNKSSNKEFKMETPNSFTVSSNNTVEITTNYNEARSFAAKTAPKLGFVKNPKQKKLREENISSSDEDFSWNSKKRPLEKRFTSTKIEEFTIEKPDDGITKSMYEMYYKEKVTPVRLKAEDRRKKIRLTEKIENNTESSRRQRKRKRFSPDEPLLHGTRRRYNNRINRRQMENEQEERDLEVVPKKVSRRGVPPSPFRYPDDEDDEVDDYDDDENDDTYSSIEKSKSRWKRSHTEVPTDPNSSDEATEPEYIVTLRPTQIRTFVVWFESQKSLRHSKNT